MTKAILGVQNSKTQKLKLNPSQDTEILLEEGKVYLLACSVLNSNSIATTTLALVCTREWSGKEGKIHLLLGKFTDTMSATLEENILHLQSGSWNTVTLSRL